MKSFLFPPWLFGGVHLTLQSNNLTELFFAFFIGSNLFSKRVFLRNLKLANTRNKGLPNGIKSQSVQRTVAESIGCHGAVKSLG